MQALGEDPREYNQFVESLAEAWQPANALEDVLLRRLARTLWCLERGDRIQDSQAAMDIHDFAQEKADRDLEAYDVAAANLPSTKALAASAAAENFSTERSDMDLFANAFGDNPRGEPLEILKLLHRLRAPRSHNSAAAETFPQLVPEGPAAEGEERQEALTRLRELLTSLIEFGEKCVPLGEAKHRLVLHPFERDAVLGPEGPGAALLLRMQDSNMRQLWRIINILFRTREAMTSRHVP